MFTKARYISVCIYSVIQCMLVTEWMRSLYKQQWERMLLAYQGVDSGPEEDVSEEQFDSLAFRCGRILDDDMQVSANFVNVQTSLHWLVLLRYFSV